MSSPAPCDPLPRDVRSGRPQAWADCPRCGEHWPGGSPYCVNCGWTPDSPGATTNPVAPARAGRGLALLLAAGLATALWLLLWAWTDDRDAASPQAPHPGAATASVVTQASTPSAPASAPAEPLAPAAGQASTIAAAEAASRPATQATATEPPAAPSPAPDPAHQADQTDQFVRDWLAAEAGAAGNPSALRSFYADQVAYRGRNAAGWTTIAADKARFMQRWPGRHYELLAVHTLSDGPEGQWQGALHVRWRLENQGRWRRGESVTLLTLRRIDGRWRIVAEAAGEARPRPAAPGLPA